MVETYKNKFNKKHHFPKDASHSISEISELSGYEKSGLMTIKQKGMAAFYNNRAAVRPQVKSPQQWALARIYSAITPGSKASKVDASHLIKK
jgi:hypothetical protein